MGYMKVLYEDIWELHCSDPLLDNEQIADRLDCPVGWVDSVLKECYDNLSERSGN
jgi:hypothetical protein